MSVKFGRPLLDEVVLDYGPLERLSRCLIAGDAIARQHGITLSFETLETVVEINRRNGDSWLPITPTYDPSVWRGDDHNAFAIVGRDSAGEIVTTHATRVFHWSTDTNFGAEANALRIFYRNPEADANSGESCHVTAPSAYKVTGRVALGGGIWIRPDFRGSRLTQLMGRMGRAYVIGKYDITHHTAVMTETVFNRGLWRISGYSRIDHWMDWRHSRLAERVRLCFLEMTIPETLDDLEATLIGSVDRRSATSPVTQRDADITDRRT